MNATKEAKRTRQFWVSLRRERVTHVFFYFLLLVHGNTMNPKPLYIAQRPRKINKISAELSTETLVKIDHVFI